MVIPPVRFPAILASFSRDGGNYVDKIKLLIILFNGKMVSPPLLSKLHASSYITRVN